MDAARHAALGGGIGAAVAVAPDAALLFYGWRRRQLPRTHPLVRLHAVLHRAPGLVLAVGLLAWLSHLIADRFTHPRGWLDA